MYREEVTMTGREGKGNMYKNGMRRRSCGHGVWHGHESKSRAERKKKRKAYGTGKERPRPKPKLKQTTKKKHTCRNLTTTQNPPNYASLNPHQITSPPPLYPTPNPRHPPAPPFSPIPPSHNRHDKQPLQNTPNDLLLHIPPLLPPLPPPHLAIHDPLQPRILRRGKAHAR
ncbi:hypothetical protein M422DRAFT_780190 [Sphaerobolus stellatus SS14]|uniref:Uncharacterized protein n=1 Tax=Sphaerobolus stellatus (strain SS14) TaxID=990650 RepID=A0A0C9V568_SPHS4|nr:hypothetical protein M422DRAFT_780190 [Sphaerobolus stellatus SS14]